MLLPGKVTAVDSILSLTAFAAGSVDVLSFATLGGAFASAMTGNLALLAFYTSEGNSRAAVGSMIALSCFVLGCAMGVLQRRGKAQNQALSLLLISECGLLLVFAFYAAWVPGSYGQSHHMQIAVLSVAMGLQSIIGQTISLTTIVFTTTLTKLVGTVTDSIAGGNFALLRELNVPSAVITSYLIGAVLAGTLVVNNVAGSAFLPFVGVASALVVHRWTQGSLA